MRAVLTSIAVLFSVHGCTIAAIVKECGGRTLGCS